MVCVTIQPYDYENMKSVQDIKEIAILKFPHKYYGIGDPEAHEVLYSGELNDEALEILKSEIKDKTVITYNSNLYNHLVKLIKEENPDFPDDYKVTGLMQVFSKKFKPRGAILTKLSTALAHYNITVHIDTSDPLMMCVYTILLYRNMEDDENFISFFEKSET